MIEEITEKLKNGYYLSNELKTDEIIYILDNESLKKDFIDFLSSQPGIELKLDKIENSIIIDFIDFLFEADLGSYSNDKKINYIINSCTFSFIEKDFKIDLLDDIALEYNLIEGLNEEEIKKINDYLNNYVLDEKNKVSFYGNDQTIVFLLDNKRYDLISKLNFNIYDDISETVKNRIKNEFPISKYGLSPIVVLSNGINVIESFSDEEILNLLNKMFDELYFNEEKLQIIFLDVLDRLANSNSESLESKIYEILVNSTRNYSFEKIKKDTLIKLVEKGFINKKIMDFMEEKSYMSKEQLLDIFFKNFDKSDDKIKFLRLNLVEISDLQKYIFFKDVSDSLIYKGYGLLLLRFLYNIDPMTLNTLERQLDINKVEYIDSIIIKKEYIDNDVLFNYIVNNIKVDDILFYNKEYNDFEEKDINKIKKIVKKNNASIRGLPYFNRDYFDMYLKNKEYYDIAYQYFCVLNDNAKKEALEWLKEHQDNLVLLKILVTHYSCNIDVIKLALNMGIFHEIIINKLIHIDNLTIDMEIFDKLKSYCSEKYNLNEKNMELLAKNFGPKIILYLEDENMQRIINLSEEELIKIINIFPMDYSLLDVKAAHESIMQYSFKQNERNYEIVNIFDKLKKVIENKDVDLINKYKYMAISYIDIDFYKTLQDKYQELKEFDLESGIDFLINNILDEKYRKILHELTDNAIICARKYYVCDEYYKRSNQLYIQLSKIDDLAKNIRNVDSKIDWKKILDNDIFSKLTREAKEKILKKYNYSSHEELIRDMIEMDDYRLDCIVSDLKRVMIDCMRMSRKYDFSPYAEVGLEYEYDEKSKRRELEKYIMDNLMICHVGSTTLDNIIENELKKKGISNELAVSIINHYAYKLHTYSDIKEIQKYKDLYYGITTKLVKENYEEISAKSIYIESILKELDCKNRIKRTYKTENYEENVYKIFSKLNIDLIRKNILNNDEEYDRLVKIMSKFKPHLLSTGFSKMIDTYEVPITSDFSDVSAFINYFVEIENKFSNTTLSIANILNQSGVYSSVNSIYSAVLGLEDAKLIKSNLPNNSATRKTKNNMRLNEAVMDTVILFKRDAVLIPTFDEEYEVSNSNKIRAIVGNFTAPSNLTHGERTGACMRIGGAGEELFNFCIKDKAGFHIRFEDPKTNKYISRVSGFRNGNTVYLNQLRESLDKKYNNEDLISVTKQISQKLIELTKDSEYPIENVFVTASEATIDDKTLPRYRLDIDTIKKGLGKIYTDYSYREGQLLATTAGSGYVPLVSGNEKIKEYKVQRSKPIINMNINEAKSRINRVIAVNQLLNGINLSDLHIDIFNEGMIYSIVNDDWYIYVTENLEIRSGVIRGNNEAYNEFNKYFDIVKNKINSNEIKEDIYGL